MTILGIDYGKRYIGLALVSGLGVNISFPAPLPALRFRGSKQILDDLIKVCKRYGVNTVVFGLPLLSNVGETNLAGEIRIFARQFSERAENREGPPFRIYFADERLTSFEAGVLIQDVKKTRDGKRRLENSLAACLILRNFLDLHPEFN